MSQNLQAVKDSLLGELKQRFSQGNPNSRKLFDQACQAMPGGNTRSNLYFSPFPLYFTHGAGATLADADGHVYTDFLGEYTAGIFGHSHPRLLDALRAVSEQGLNFGGPNRWEGLLAKALVDRFPAMERLRFTNSGTEANLFALGAARAFTRKNKIIVFEGAYHGGTLTFASKQHPLNAPFDFLFGQYNDADSVRRLIADHRGQIAAMLVEPMLSSGGCIPGSEAFLRDLRDMTAQSGIVMILDEVVTSRFGPSGLHGRLDLKPDLVTLGKYIGGGLSCGAFGGRTDIMDQFDTTRTSFVTHSGTHNNNTLSLGVGYTAITEVFTSKVAEELSAAGDVLRRRLNRIVLEAGLAMQFTGLGLSMNLHFTDATIERPSADTRGHQTEKALYFFHLLSRGLYIAPRGMINVSMAHSPRDIDTLVDATKEFTERYGELITASHHKETLP